MAQARAHTRGVGAAALNYSYVRSRTREAQQRQGFGESEFGDKRLHAEWIEKGGEDNIILIYWGPHVPLVALVGQRGRMACHFGMAGIYVHFREREREGGLVLVLGRIM